MRKRSLLPVLFCLFLCLTGCGAREAAKESTTEYVIIIQNASKETTRSAQTAAPPSVTAAAGSSRESAQSEQESKDGYTYEFAEDMDYEIKDFVRQYYDYLAEGEYDLAAYMTNDSSRLDKEAFMERGEYIESIKSLSCYMMEGMVEGTYIVVAKCGVVTTLGPEVLFMMEAFYICRNESGTLYICGNSVGDEVKSYNSIMLSAQGLADIAAEAAADNESSVSLNEELAKLEGIIYTESICRYLYEQPAAEKKAD